MVLYLGSSGQEVKTLQNNLIRLGYTVGKSGADGYLGAFTEKAIKEFQSNHGLAIDGKAGEKTLLTINNALATTSGQSALHTGFNLSGTSLKRLNGVHPDLVKVVKRAIEITPQDFIVQEGVRTVEQQRKNIKKGVSKTMKSRHIPQCNKCGICCAVDLVPLVDGKVSWDWQYYYPLADAVKKAAKELNVAIEWGGDWKTFKDGPHYQLSWLVYL